MAVKVVLYFVGFDIWLHFFYSYAFNQYNYWRMYDFAPHEICMMGFWTLNFMYMKFLIIWRTFRIIALLDGIDSPGNESIIVGVDLTENMNRCVNNNFTFVGFWRSWHGSLNQWIVRYVYIALGGRRTQVWNVWIVFIFVGLWHDLWIRWVAWALLNCVFFVTELLIQQLFAQPSVGNFIQQLTYVV